jgi:HAD superfamily hydrolase (TIGR01509 family)
MSRHVSPATDGLRVRGVIFDVDGTLADSLGLFYQIACEVMDAAGLAAPTREQVYGLMRAGDAAPLENLFPPGYPDVAGTVRAIVERRMAAWMDRYNRETEAIPGTVEVLHQLHGRGVLLGIATSSGRDLPFLNRWGVRHLFSGIVGREDVQARKPDPEPVRKCLERLRLEPREALYVGDSPIDVRAGKAAGTYTVGVLTGTSDYEVMRTYGPDRIVPDVSALPAVIDL